MVSPNQICGCGMLAWVPEMMEARQIITKDMKGFFIHLSIPVHFREKALPSCEFLSKAMPSLHLPLLRSCPGPVGMRGWWRRLWLNKAFLTLNYQYNDKCQNVKSFAGFSVRQKTSSGIQKMGASSPVEILWNSGNVPWLPVQKHYEHRRVKLRLAGWLLLIIHTICWQSLCCQAHSQHFMLVRCSCWKGPLR